MAKPRVQDGEQQGAQAAADVALTQFASPSLYVGDLEPNVSEAGLYEVFSTVGQIISIRVCRDLITRRSLGYAYVNYSNAQDATRALELLNFSVVNGKPMRIMFSDRSTSKRKGGKGNIFIKNLDKSIDNKALCDTFSQIGNILSCKVVTDSSGESKGYGFVQFENEESAQIAIEKVNGKLLNDKQVFVGPFIPRQERGQSGGACKFKNVYVRNLERSTTDDDLQKIFGVYGTIGSAVVMRDNDGISKRFGFVNFEHANDAAKAIEALNGKKINGKEWYVARAQEKSERKAEVRAKYEGVNVHVTNFDRTVDDEKLRELFSEYGTITSCKVMRDDQGQSRCYGFVAFSSPVETARAVTAMNGKMVGTNPLSVAFAQRMEERRAMYHKVPVVPINQELPVAPSSQQVQQVPVVPINQELPVAPSSQQVQQVPVVPINQELPVAPSSQQVQQVPFVPINQELPVAPSSQQVQQVPFVPINQELPVAPSSQQVQQVPFDPRGQQNLLFHSPLGRGEYNQEVPFIPYSQQVLFNPNTQQAPFIPYSQQVPFNPHTQQAPFIRPHSQQVLFSPHTQQAPFVQQPPGLVMHFQHQVPFVPPNQQLLEGRESIWLH